MKFINLNYFILLSCICLVFACNPKEELNASTLPECLQQRVDQGELNTEIIKLQEINNEFHYWVNTGANALDGDEYIYNNKCDTVCYYGGWINPDCLENYDRDAWIDFEN